ncbi:DUF5641 domain-containing protein [Trichonephila clavipes]|nr:DUF5641 domain-containing protein [Trichonephila clavipes]
MFNLVCKPDEALASYMASEGIDCRSITSIVEPDLTNLNENRLDNWQKITKIIQLIWKSWSVDYLNSLQQRNKWHFEKKNAKIGDMFIIKEDNLPSCQWSLGRINNIYPGKDSKVRVVEVKTTRAQSVEDISFKIDMQDSNRTDYSDEETSSASCPLDIPLTQDRVLPPDHWTYPRRRTYFCVQATGHTPDAGHTSASKPLDISLKAGQNSATRTLDIPLKQDRALRQGH